MSAFNIWKENRPPKYTWVWAKYGLKEDWMLVRTCGHGCCVFHIGMSSMILPKFWREATPDEAVKADAEMQTRVGIDDVYL